MSFKNFINNTSSDHVWKFGELRKLLRSQKVSVDKRVVDAFKELLADMESLERLCAEPAVAAAILQHDLNCSLKDRVEDMQKEIDKLTSCVEIYKEYG